MLSTQINNYMYMIIRRLENTFLLILSVVIPKTYKPATTDNGRMTATSGPMKDNRKYSNYPRINTQYILHTLCWPCEWFTVQTYKPVLEKKEGSQSTPCGIFFIRLHSNYFFNNRFGSTFNLAQVRYGMSPINHYFYFNTM